MKEGQVLNYASALSEARIQSRVCMRMLGRAFDKDVLTKSPVIFQPELRSVWEGAGRKS